MYVHVRERKREREREGEREREFVRALYSSYYYNTVKPVLLHILS